MSLLIDLQRDGDVTLQEQIYRFIRDRILDGSYRNGFQLPSTRELAQSLKIARNTAMLAYDWLTTEGYIETRRGAGTFVCETLTDMEVPAEPRQAAVRRRNSALLRKVARYETPVLISRTTKRPRFDFWYGKPDARLFPGSVWRRLTLENLSRAAAVNFSDYGDQAGNFALRQAIAEHLGRVRGLFVRPDQIIVTAGAQEGLNIVGRLFVSADTTFHIEDPGYGAVASVMESYGAEIAPVPVDGDGLCVECLPESGQTLVYTTPSHQFPTGAVLSLARRQALIDWAERTDAFIIEDDYDSEIVFDRPPLAALASIDRCERVIYLGSFSKVIGAGIRLGYLVLPASLVSAAIAVKSLGSYGNPWLDQAILADFMREGHFQAHLRRVRTAYRARRDVLLRALAVGLGPEVEVSGQEGGLHVLCRLPPHLGPASALAAKAWEAGVGLYTPEQAGVRTHAAHFGDRALVMGYAALQEDEIERAISRVAACLDGTAAE